MVRPFRYVSLFAGIGGLDLAMDRLGGECTLQVDIDPFCLSVLERRWPGVPKAADIKDVDPADLVPVDLMVGGFPCQPVSYAGRRAGKDDPRWLWPEFFRLIRGAMPTMVLIENVPGLRTKGLDEVLSDLESAGYGGAWEFVSAADVGAQHLRVRLFVLAVRGRRGFLPRTRTAQPKKGPGYQAFPTPGAQDGHWRGTPAVVADRLARGKALTLEMELMRRQLFPTPRAADANAAGPGTSDEVLARRGDSGRHGNGRNLSEEVQVQARKLWPTPTSRDYKDTGDVAGNGGVPVNGLLGRAVKPSIVTGPLNPDWVEWLMGFPVGWTTEAPTGALVEYSLSEEPELELSRLAKGVPMRRQRLTALGNAVVNQCAYAAFLHLAGRLGIDTTDPMWFTPYGSDSGPADGMEVLA